MTRRGRDTERLKSMASGMGDVAWANRSVMIDAEACGRQNGRDIQGDEVWDVMCANCPHARSEHHIGSEAIVVRGCPCGCDQFAPRTVHEALDRDRKANVEIASVWHPISEIPLATWVLIWIKGTARESPEAINGIRGRYDGDTFWDGAKERPLHSASHWMPMPRGPE